MLEHSASIIGAGRVVLNIGGKLPGRLSLSMIRALSERLAISVDAVGREHRMQEATTDPARRIKSSSAARG